MEKVFRYGDVDKDEYFTEEELEQMYGDNTLIVPAIKKEDLTNLPLEDYYQILIKDLQLKSQDLEKKFYEYKNDIKVKNE